MLGSEASRTGGGLRGEQKREVGFRLRRIREELGWDRGELADRLGVHPGSIARWESGGSVPHRYHLEQIAVWGGTTADAILASGPPDEDQPAPAFPSASGVRGFLEDFPPGPHRRSRRLDALEGLRRMLSAAGSLPDWWYDLRREVEGEENGDG